MIRCLEDRCGAIWENGDICCCECDKMNNCIYVCNKLENGGLKIDMPCEHKAYDMEV